MTEVEEVITWIRMFTSGVQGLDMGWVHTLRASSPNYSEIEKRLIGPDPA